MKNISIQSRIRSTTVVTSLLVAGVLGLSNQAIAASQCKGLDNSACGAAANCGWVQGYERKDGRQVRSFCRTTSKSSAKKSATKQSTAKKAASGSKTPATSGKK